MLLNLYLRYRRLEVQRIQLYIVEESNLMATATSDMCSVKSIHFKTFFSVFIKLQKSVKVPAN